MFGVFPINGQTWLVCGGRDFTDRDMLRNVMLDLMSIRGCPARILHGAARGADTLAGEWAERMAIEVVAVPADWKTHSRSAGPIRNQTMLDMRPDFVVAFPGGRGTADMVRRSREAGIDERRLHERFAQYRHRNEWFRRGGDLDAWISDGCPVDSGEAD